MVAAIAALRTLCLPHTNSIKDGDNKQQKQDTSINFDCG